MTSPRTRTPARRPPARPPRQRQAWHIVTTNGADHTVSAHHCDHYDGVLTFRDYAHDFDDNGEPRLVRAFAAGVWVEVELVDLTKVAPTV